MAALAAGGRTNRQIADELFVTIKAVEWHLGNAYRKLDIRGRAQLAERAGPARRDRGAHLTVRRSPRGCVRGARGTAYLIGPCSSC